MITVQLIALSTCLIGNHCNLDTLHLNVGFQRFRDLGERKVMCYQFFHWQADSLGPLQKGEGCGIFLGRVNP